MNEEWHTNKSVCTNEQGIAEIEGYRGDYIAKCGNMQGMFKLEKIKPGVQSENAITQIKIG